MHPYQILSISPEDFYALIEATFLLGAMCFASFPIAGFLASVFTEKLIARYSTKLAEPMDLKLDYLNMAAAQISGLLGMGYAMAIGPSITDGLLPQGGLLFLLDLFGYTAKDSLANLPTSYFTGFEPFLLGIAISAGMAVFYTGLNLATAKPLTTQPADSGIGSGEDGPVIAALALSESFED